ncbi:MAG: dihydrofolate reductase [Patescibacteria group bacterium]
MNPLIFMVAAVDENNVIGVDNNLPWQLPDDLRHFRTLTENKPIIMGRKTFASIGRALPNRKNIVMTRDHDLDVEGVTVVHSLEEALKATDGAAEVAIIGGGHIFALFLPLADRIYLTRVKTSVQGDVFFPVIMPDKWVETARSSHPQDAKHAFAFDFITFDRINSS